MSENKIVIKGREIDCADLTDNQLIKLYNEVADRQIALINFLANYPVDANLIKDSGIEELWS
jgi:hypothetical protein